jgi:hypothetical protein
MATITGTVVKDTAGYFFDNDDGTTRERLSKQGAGLTTPLRPLCVFISYYEKLLNSLL